MKKINKVLHWIAELIFFAFIIIPICIIGEWKKRRQEARYHLEHERMKGL